MEISKFPEILGELSMHKQCIPGSSFSAHTREPGNKAKYTIVGKVMSGATKLNCFRASQLHSPSTSFAQQPKLMHMWSIENRVWTLLLRKTGAKF